MSNSSVRPMDRTLLGATTPGLGGPGSDGNEGVPRVLQSSSITEFSPPVSYPGQSLGESHLSAETQSVYSATPSDWASVK